MPDRVKATEVLFIKLGSRGKWEKDCIERHQTIRLGFNQANHAHCLRGHWDRVQKYYLQRFKAKKNSKGEASRTVNQIRQFYEEPESTMWLTFYANRLWWSFAKSKVTQLSDKTKIRRVIGKWSDRDVEKKPLLADSLGGKLLRTQGYRGTICKVKAAPYVLAKINADELKEVAVARVAFEVFQAKLRELIKLLHWKDFETLVDLVFRQAGWQRVGQLGKTQKTLDLDLSSPVTNERAIVQIKSTSNRMEFFECLTDFENMQGYKTLFYVVHSPHKSLTKMPAKKHVRLILPDEITGLAINAGLSKWIMDKSS